MNTLVMCGLAVVGIGSSVVALWQMRYRRDGED